MSTTETMVALPDFFIALVLPYDKTFRDPTDDETEELRRQTVQFWNQQLGAIYNNNSNYDENGGASKPRKNKNGKKTAVAFGGIDLVVNNAIYGPRVGSDSDLKYVDLDNRFNVYLELGGRATFAVSNGSNKTKKPLSAPTGNDVFRKMVAGDSMEYLCGYVKNEKETKNGTATSVYSRACEVCARRLREDPNDQAFVVRTPTFFVAMATDPFDDEEARDPTEAEVTELTKRTKERIEHHIREDYPSALVDCQLALVRSEIGTSKPDDRFHLYYEHEVTATFSADPPSPEELFAIIMRCANSGFPLYMKSLRKMNGTPYVAVTMMTIQIVELEDQPEPQPLEELPPPPPPPPPPKKEEEEKEEEEQGSGDEKEEEDEGSETKEPQPPPPPPPPPPPTDELVTRKVPIFLALVVSALPPAKLPTVEELKEFEHLVLRYFYTVLKNKHGDTLVDMVLTEQETHFDSGIPEPRFNMCVEYEAAIRFRDDPTTPEKRELKKLILKVNLGTLLAHVKDLEPLCFERCSEISMRKKPKKQTLEKQKIKDAAFEASVDVELMEPPVIEDETKDILLAIAAAKEKAKANSAKIEARKKMIEEASKPSERDLIKKPSERDLMKKAEEKLITKKDAIEKKTEEKAAKKKAEEKLAQLAKKRFEKEEAAKRKAEEEAAEKEAEEEAAKKKAIDAAKKIAEEAAKAAADDVRVAAEKAKKAASPKTKKKKKPKREKRSSRSRERTTPTGSHKSSDSTDDPSVRRIKTAEVYTAFKLKNCEADPPEEEYEKLRQNTQKFFTKRLKKEFGSKLGDVRLKIHHQEFGSGRPQKHFNVYVEWDIEAFYKTDDATLASVSANRQEHTIGDGDADAEGVLSPEKLTKILVKDTDLTAYLMKAVQPLHKTAFANVTMGFMGAKVATKTTF